MPPLLCTGRDDVERTFEYSIAKDQFEETWHFRLQTVPPQPDGEAFDLSVTTLDDATVRQVMLAHHDNPAYVAMGIPDALIPVVAGVLAKQVVSSPTTADDTGVYRTEAATKVWDRWYNVIIHSLPIESWVVEDEAISERDRLPLGLFKSGSKLGPLRNRRSLVRIVTGGKPRIHQLEQESRRCSLLLRVIQECQL